MQVSLLVSNINSLLAGEMLSQSDLLLHINEAIDDVNMQLSTSFPAMEARQAVYDAIPDTYMRSVIALGSALHYYGMDEEGEFVAQNYQMRYQKNLFMMLRDYSIRIPKEYLQDEAGYLEMEDGDGGSGGVSINASDYTL